jgi:hypothetical protein
MNANVDAAPGTAPAGAVEPPPQAWRGLVWREWLAHGPLALNFLAAWLVCGWVLLLFFHPGWILGFGVLYAFFAGALFGGGDAFEGSEEFSFALPPTRGEQYLVRLAAGGAPLLLFTLVGLLAIGLDLPQAFWGLFVSSGYTEPFEPARPAFLQYGLAFAVPAAAYAFTYAVAALAGSRAAVMGSWLAGGLFTGGVVLGGLLLEAALWDRVNGFVTCPALLALAPLALLAGYVRYLRKEGVSRPSPLHAASRGWFWLILAVVIGLILIMFTLFVSVREAKMDEAMKVERAMEMDADVRRVPPSTPGGGNAR